MAAILRAVLFFFALEFAHATMWYPTLVSFDGPTCRYDTLFFNKNDTIPGNKCSRLLCNAKKKSLTVEECAESNPSGRFNETFPYCCWPRGNSSRRYFEYTSTTHHDGELIGAVEVPKRLYKGLFKGIDLCKNNEWNFCPEDGGAQTCCSVTQSKETNTTLVQWCPFLHNSSAANGVLVRAGKPNTKYPSCCPKYLNGPAKIHYPCNGSEVHGGNEISGCYYKPGNDGHGEKCISRDQMRNKGCKEELDLCHLRSLRMLNAASSKSSKCPRMICPNITAELVTVPERWVYVNGMIQDNKHNQKFCTYNKTKFQGAVKSSSPCEEWRCDYDAAKVWIKKCSNETLPEHCTWAGGNESEMFPGCCRLKTCEWEYKSLL